VVALTLQPLESRHVAGCDLALLGRAEPLPPALPVSGLGGHLALEELPHRRLVLDTEEVEQLGVGAFPVAPDELIQTDEVKALAVARRQASPALELRAAVALARVRLQRGEGTHARVLVAPVRERFSEGFDTPDLRDAATLLSEGGATAPGGLPGVANRIPT
jgi:hypothetical protein